MFTAKNEHFQVILAANMAVFKKDIEATIF
jgi:hypothetical protein